MNDNLPSAGLQLRSTLGADGALTLQLTEAEVVQPGPDEVVVRLEAVPINPSDMMTLFANADPTALQFEPSPQDRKVTLQLPPKAARGQAGRVGEPIPVGLGGAGVVVAAGKNAERLLGRKVSTLSLAGGTFGQFVTVAASECLRLPPEVSLREGADIFCNPMTALTIVEAVRLEGHSALIHTAAASNLGQMLVRICREDGIALVNVVRREEQADLLRRLGAVHVCNSSLASFPEDLREAAAATGARIAFDAIGGGTMAGELLAAMEHAAVSRMDAFSPYGSHELKQVFIYGHLDPSPTLLRHDEYGMYWNLRHWAMPATLAQVGPERAAELQQRVIAELKTTFASHYSREISLAQALEPETILAYARTATGEKFLLNPAL